MRRNMHCSYGHILNVDDYKVGTTVRIFLSATMSTQYESVAPTILFYHPIGLLCSSLP